MVIFSIYLFFYTFSLLYCIVLFEGASTLSVDAKGRVSVPTRYRDALIEQGGGYMHLTCHFQETCLLLFAEPEWLAFRERVAAWPMSAAWLKRMVLNQAESVEMDATNGRILLPRPLREITQIGKEVMFVGNGSHFELWDKDSYMTKLEQARKAPLPDFLEDFSF